MIAGWMFSVLCCHALGFFDGSTVVGAVPDPPGVAEVEECIGNYTNSALYNVGPHLMLKNWTLTHTELSVFCRTNVTDLYRCMEPHIKTEENLTSSILRSFEHLCNENQQPEWLRHSTCVPYDLGTCVTELQDKEAVVTLYGVIVDPAKIPDHQCRLMKDYVKCVYASIEEVEVCGTAAADWHTGVIRMQWRPYSPINTCDIFDDLIPPPPEVAEVMTCMRNYTDSVLYNVGLHLVLKNQTLTETEVSVFCKTDVLDLYMCIEPYRETVAKTLTESLTKAFEHICDKKQQKEWVRYSDCVPTEDMDSCVTDLQTAWITLYELKVDDKEVPEVGDERVPDQCRLMKDYVKCVYEMTKEVCGTAAADWHTAVIRKIWRPYRDIIACDVYGPTGGTVGLITGIVVGLLLISICGLLIWYNPKKADQSTRQLRASTAL